MSVKKAQALLDAYWKRNWSVSILRCTEDTKDR